LKSLKGNRTRPLTVAEGPSRGPPPRRPEVRRRGGPRATGRAGRGGTPFGDAPATVRRGAGGGGEGAPGSRPRGLTAPRADVPPGRDPEDERPRGGAGERERPAKRRGARSVVPRTPARRSRTTRLETRTKESNTYASLGERNPRAQRKRNGREAGGPPPSASPAGPPRGGPSRSVRDGTRKMVN
jgi:hypothetical protein